MIYAIIKTGGKQIKVTVGEPIFIEKIDNQIGEMVTFTEVVGLNDGKELHIGKPFVKAEISGEVQKQGKHKKLIIFRTKNKSNWSRKQGHRQTYTRVLVNSISFNGKVIADNATTSKKAKVAKPVAKATPVSKTETTK